MTFQIVRNALGDVVCFGPDDNNYAPTVKKGDVLSIENTPPLAYLAALTAEASALVAARENAIKKLCALGLTISEVESLLG